MLTVIESPLFSTLWRDYWAEDEHRDFISYIAANPDAGDVIPGTGGCRKIRWLRTGTGKRGGVRVIYVTRLINGAVVLLTIYGKNVKETIPAHILQRIAEELGHATP